MTLTEYLNGMDGTTSRGLILRDGKELARVAKKSKCSPRTLAMIATGYRRAGVTLARRIEHATGGRVAWTQLVRA